MKIAILLLSGGVVQRGAEVGMLMLAEDLFHLGHQVDVFQAGPKPQFNDLNSIKIHFIQLNLPLKPISHKPKSFMGKVLERLYLDRRGLLTLLFSIKFVKHIIDHPNSDSKYDILFPVDGFWQILACKIIKKIKGGKIVVSGKAGPGWTDADNLRLRPDIFIPISQPAEVWARSINAKQPLFTIGEAIDVDLFNPQLEPVNLNLTKPIIITVAAFTPYKRIDLVIRAVAKMKHASLLVVGQGELESHLSSLGTKLLGNRFSIQHAQYQQLPAIYTACSVFTLASEPQEAFGRVLIEAQASGLPIVTTDDPLRRWMVGKSGLFIDPTDSDAYAQALQQAIDNRTKEQSLKNAQRFSRQSIAEAYSQVFNKLLHD